MKKIIAIALCLMLCLTAAAFAETHTSVTGAFTIDVPDDWYVIDSAETLQEVLDAGKSVMQDQGLANDQLLATLENVDYTTMDYFYTSDFTGSLNVITTPDSGLTADMLVSLKDSLDQSLIESYVNVGATEENCLPQDPVTLGNYTFYRFEVKDFLGSDISQYITCDSQNTMFTVTFTGVDQATMEAVVASLVSTAD